MADRDRRSSEQRDEAEGFLRRWSRRKAEARSAETARAGEASDPDESTTAALRQAPEADDGVPAPVDPNELPDLESLHAGSDFTAFMRPGVPEQLRTLALRRLWRSDPIFSKLDGLVEYGEDYTIAAWPKGTIKTAYQTGRGFADQLEKLGAEPAPAAPEEAAAAPASEPGAAAELPEVDPAGAAATPLSEPGASAAEPLAADRADAPSWSRSSAREQAQLVSSGAASVPAASAAPKARIPATARSPAEHRPRPLPRRG